MKARVKVLGYWSVTAHPSQCPRSLPGELLLEAALLLLRAHSLLSLLQDICDATDSQQQPAPASDRPYL